MITLDKTSQLEDGQPVFLLMNSSVVYWNQQSVSSACAEGGASNNLLVLTSCEIQFTAAKYQTGVQSTQNVEYDPSILPVDQTFNSTSFVSEDFGQVVQVTAALVTAEVDSGQWFSSRYLDNNAYTAYFNP